MIRLLHRSAIVVLLALGASGYGHANVAWGQSETEVVNEKNATAENSEEQTDEEQTEEEQTDEEQPKDKQPDDTPAAVKPARPVGPLAAVQWRQRTPRWIGLYGSQLADLIPESFRPISIDDLADALGDVPTPSVLPSEMPARELIMVARIEGDEIVSRASRLVFPSSELGTAIDKAIEVNGVPTRMRRFRLGPVNLAITDSRARPTTSPTAANPDPASDRTTGQIVSDGNGDCFAIVTDAAEVEFDWSSRCQYVSQGKRWTLRFPDATLTRFFLIVDANSTLELDGGSAVRLEQLPAWAFDQADALEATTGYWIEPTPGRPLTLLVRDDGNRTSSSNSQTKPGTGDSQLASAGTSAETSAETSAPAMTVVRGCRMRTQWIGNQLQWTCRLTVDTNVAGELSRLDWVDAEVTSVRRDQTQLPMDWNDGTASWTNPKDAEIGIGQTSPMPPPHSSTTFMFEGISFTQGKSVRLPRPLLPEDRFLVPPQTWQLQLQIPAENVLHEIRLPDRWDVRMLPPEGTGAAIESSTRAVTPTRSLASVTWVASGRAPLPDEPWSINVGNRDALVFAKHQVRFEMDETSIQARGKLMVEMPAGSIRPITLELQDGFQFDFVGVGEARRSVPIGTVTSRSRRVTIWPGGDEIVDSRVAIYCTARAQRNNLAGRAIDAKDPNASSQNEKTPASPTASNREPSQGQTQPAPPTDADSDAKDRAKDRAKANAMTPDSARVDLGNRGAAIGPQSIQRVGELWLMRVADCPGQLLATIIPPSNLSWSAKASIEPARRAFADLTPTQRRFFAPLPGDAIVFGGAIEATPAITLAKPDINLSVSLKTHIAGRWKKTPNAAETSTGPSTHSSGVSPRIGDPVWQTLEVKTEGTAGEIGSMRIRFAAESDVAIGDAATRDAMQWSVQLQNNQAEIPIEENGIGRDYLENTNTWEVRIALPPQFTNQSLLIGRRRQSLPADGSALTIGLPHVPDAASQSAEVWIDACLQLQQQSEALKGVPTLANAWPGPEPTRSASAMSGGQPRSSFASLARYRYETNDQPRVHLMPRIHHVPSGMVVGQRLTSVASVSGTDTLTLSCLIRSQAEISLTFPPSLHLLEIRRDGLLVDPRVLPGHGVVIPLGGRGSTNRSSMIDRDSGEPFEPAGFPTTGFPTTGFPTSEASSSNDPAMTSSAPRWTQIEVQWLASSPRGHWYRWYEFPEIEIDQLIIDSRCELFAATGTNVFQIPDLEWAWSGPTPPLLLPSGLSMGIGWVAAFTLLGLARFVGTAGIGSIVFGIFLAIVAALFWPLASMPLMVFIAVPLTLAAMQLTTSQRIHQHQKRTEKTGSLPPHRSDDEKKRSAAPHSSPRPSPRDQTSLPDEPAAIPSPPEERSDSWTRRFGAGEIISSEIRSDDVFNPTDPDSTVKPVPQDALISGAPIPDAPIPDDSIPDDSIADDSISGESAVEDSPGGLSSSTIVPFLIAMVWTFACPTNVLPWAGAQPPINREIASETATAPNVPPTSTNQNSSGDDSVASTIDVLVPTQSDGKLLGNKIYIPEAFYNELYVTDERSRVESPMIQRVSYRLRLKSPTTDQSPREPNSATPVVPTDPVLSSNLVVANELVASIELVTPVIGRRVKLPFRFDQVSGADQVRDDGDNQSLRWGDDGEGWVWVELPSSTRDAARLKIAPIMLSLRCQTERQTPWLVVSAALPPIATTRLSITADTDVHSVILEDDRSSRFVDVRSNDTNTMLGPTVFANGSSTPQRADPISLGPQRQLDVRYLVGPKDSAVSTMSDAGIRRPRDGGLPWEDESFWQKRFWIHSHAGKTVIECEMEPRRTLPPEVIVTLFTTPPTCIDETNADAANELGEELSAEPAPRCEQLDQQWKLQNPNESPPGLNPTLRLMSLSQQAHPIRLGWSLRTPTRGSWRVRLPQIRITPNPDSNPTVAAPGTETLDRPDTPPNVAEDAAAETSPPWIAWTFSDDLRPDWSTLGELEPLAVDQFYAKWTGYLSSIDRAVVGTVNEISLQHIPAAKSSLNTRHEITIGSESQQVRFFAEVNAPEAASATAGAPGGTTQYSIELPADVRLLDWRFDPTDATSDDTSLTDDGNIATGQGMIANENVTGDFNGGDSRGISPLTSTSAKPPSAPWTVLRRGDATTLLLACDRTGFRLVLDAVLPHAAGQEPNRLALIRLKRVSDSLEPKADSPEPAPTQPTDAPFKQVHELQLTRSVDISVKWVDPVGGVRIEAAVEDAASLLARSKILMDRFTTNDSIDEAFQSARFRIRKNTQPFDIDSRITLRWEEGRWTAQTDCQVTSKYCPDYLDIAVPTRWCDSLQILPLGISTRQPTLDPAIQVLRLELRQAPDSLKDPASLENPASLKEPTSHARTFRLISRLAVSEITRVSVPEIRVIDARRHRIDVVVPTRLTNEQVRWRSNFAGPIEKPRWRVQLPETPNSPVNAELSVYAVTNPGWSIDLETLPRTDRLARLIHADHRVFVRPQSEQWLMISRFDVVPGDQVSVQMSTARSAKLLGVWAATRPADLLNASLPPSIAGENMIETMDYQWEIPLPLSRLSQTVEVLTTFPHDTRELRLPALIGLATPTENASVSWCEIPAQPSDSRGTLDSSIDPLLESDPTSQQNRSLRVLEMLAAYPEAEGLSPMIRLQWLATSAVEAIRASSDVLADRRDEEVTAWLKPWIARYRMLGIAAGRQIGEGNLNAGDSLSGAEPGIESVVPNRTLLSWEEMDVYILSQETRYFADDAFANDRLPQLDPNRSRTESIKNRLNDNLRWLPGESSTTWSDFLAVRTPPGFVDRWTFAWADQPLPVAFLAKKQDQLSETTRLEVMRVGLFVAVACLLFLVFVLPHHRPSKQPHSESETNSSWRSSWNHPAFWLFVLGLVGIRMLPLPISLGMMAAAVFLGAGDSVTQWVTRWWKTPTRTRKGMKS